MEATPAAPAEPTHEEKLQQQLAEQLQLPGLDTSAPAPRQPALEQAKVQHHHLRPPASTSDTEREPLLAGVRADDARDAGVGDGAAPVPEREGGVVPVRRLVHGLRHRSYFHLPLLAPAGTQTHGDK